MGSSLWQRALLLYDLVGEMQSPILDEKETRKVDHACRQCRRQILWRVLSDDEYQTMLNLAGKQRKTVAPDLPEYIMDRDYVSAALRPARDLDAGEAEWQRFVEELKKRKG